MKKSQLVEDIQKLKLNVVRVDTPTDVVYQSLENQAKAMNPEDNSDTTRKVYLKMKSSAQEINRNHFRVDISRNIPTATGRIVDTVNQ